jgi:hypothetical protein
VRSECSGLSVGLIVLGNKAKSDHYNTRLLDLVCSLGSTLLIGFDFEQEGPEDSYPPLEHFDSLLQEVLQRH